MNFLGLDVDDSGLETTQIAEVSFIKALIRPTSFHLATPVNEKWHLLFPFLLSRIRVLQLLKNLSDGWRVSRHVVRDLDLAAL